jgi:hypothetical protein
MSRTAKSSAAALAAPRDARGAEGRAVAAQRQERADADVDAIPAGDGATACGLSGWCGDDEESEEEGEQAADHWRHSYT